MFNFKHYLNLKHLKKKKKKQVCGNFKILTRLKKRNQILRIYYKTKEKMLLH